MQCTISGAPFPLHLCSVATPATVRFTALSRGYYRICSMIALFLRSPKRKKTDHTHKNENQNGIRIEQWPRLLEDKSMTSKRLVNIISSLKIYSQSNYKLWELNKGILDTKEFRKLTSHIALLRQLQQNAGQFRLFHSFHSSLLLQVLFSNQPYLREPGVFKGNLNPLPYPRMGLVSINK